MQTLNSNDSANAGSGMSLGQIFLIVLLVTILLGGGLYYFFGRKSPQPKTQPAVVQQVDTSNASSANKNGNTNANANKPKKASGQ